MSTCFQGLTSTLPISKSQTLLQFRGTTCMSISKLPSCSVHGLRDMALLPLEPKSFYTQQMTQTQFKQSKSKKQRDEENQQHRDGDEDEEVGISKLQVPRQKYIPVSKSDLLDSIVSMIFKSDDPDDILHFRRLAS